MASYEPPEKCPFCQAPIKGGGPKLAYYECGAKIYPKDTPHCFLWIVKGHEKDCFKS